MTAYAAHVEVSHRPGIADPAGATVERALPALGYTNVDRVHIGKVIRLVVDALDAEAARAEVEEMCERLLANKRLRLDYGLVKRVARELILWNILERTAGLTFQPDHTRWGPPHERPGADPEARTVLTRRTIVGVPEVEAA